MHLQRHHYKDIKWSITYLKTPCSLMKQIDFEIKSIDKILDTSCISQEGSLVDHIYSVLRESIINLSLLPEMPLVEKEIAGIFAISKTPVREALIRLANDRLVTIIPKSGSYVTSISIEGYLEACFIRGSLENSCVKLLAEKGISLTEQVTLNAIITEQKQLIANLSVENKSENCPFVTLDEQFHRTLFEFGGILGAWHLLESSIAQMDRVRHLKAMLGIKRSSDIVDEYSAIVEAIQNRDAIAAEEAMTKHIGSVDVEMEIISKNPEFIKSMDEFNSLISEQRKRRNANKYNGKFFVGNRVVF